MARKESPAYTLGRGRRRTLLAWVTEKRSTCVAAAICGSILCTTCLWIVHWMDDSILPGNPWPTSRGWRGVDGPTGALLYVLAYALSTGLCLWILDRREARRTPGAEFYGRRVVLRGSAPEGPPPPPIELDLRDLGHVALASEDQITFGFGWKKSPDRQTVRIPVRELTGEDDFCELVAFLSTANQDGLYSIFEAEEHVYSRPWQLAEIFPCSLPTTTATARHEQIDSCEVVVTTRDRVWRYDARTGVLATDQTDPDSVPVVRLQVRHSCVLAESGMVLAQISDDEFSRTMIRFGSGERVGIDEAEGTVLAQLTPGRRGEPPIGAIRNLDGTTSLDLFVAVPDVLAALAVLTAGRRHLHLSLDREDGSPAETAQTASESQSRMLCT